MSEDVCTLYRCVAWALLAILALIAAGESLAESPRKRSHDEAKMERLATQRDKRRAIERKYESCAASCYSTCATKARGPA